MHVCFKRRSRFTCDLWVLCLDIHNLKFTTSQSWFPAQSITSMIHPHDPIESASKAQLRNLGKYPRVFVFSIRGKGRGREKKRSNKCMWYETWGRSNRWLFEGFEVQGFPSRLTLRPPLRSSTGNLLTHWILYANTSIFSLHPNQKVLSRKFKLLKAVFRHHSKPHPPWSDRSQDDLPVNQTEL